MAEELLTIKEIAQRLDLPESNIRYYRDKFEEYLPYVGQGRKRRYKPKALEIFSFISQGLKNNLPSEEIARELANLFPRNPQVHDSGEASLQTLHDSPAGGLSTLLQTQARALEGLSFALQRQNERGEEIDRILQNQRALKKALLLVWNRQQRLEQGIVKSEAPVEKDHDQQALLLQQIERRLDRLEESVAEAGKVHPAISKIEERLRAVDSRLDRAAVSRSDLVYRANHLTSTTEELKSAAAQSAQDLAARFGEFEEQLERLNTETSTAISDLGHRLLDLSPRTEMELLRSEMASLGDNLKDVLVRIGSMEGNMAGLNDMAPQHELAGLREEVELLQKNLRDGEKAAAELSNTVSRLPIQSIQEQLEAHETSIDELIKGFAEYEQRLDAVRIEQSTESPKPKGDMAYVSANMARMNQTVQLLSTRLQEFEEKTASDMEKLNTYVRTCWSGVQKLSKFVQTSRRFTEEN
ncbi:MAG: MerR family transcriptional regulator [Desulfovibrionales bacterium]